MKPAHEAVDATATNLKNLPFELWPEEDRARWTIAVTDPEGDWIYERGALWSEGRRKTVREGYSRFLGWASRRGLLCPEVSPTDRLTSDVLNDYCQSLKTEMSSVSVAARVGTLASAMLAMWPDRGWSALTLRCSRLKLQAEPSRDKRAAVVGSLELFGLGRFLMDEAEARLTGWRAAKLFQDGLMVALLAARPLRMRNFLHLRLGTSVLFDGRAYHISVPAHETKTGAAIEVSWPGSLAAGLETFLRRHRPCLLNGVPSDGRLWIGRDGLPMRESAIRDNIKARSREAFGHAVWPHLFRDCLATSVATETPEQIAIATSMLGHTTMQTAERYYNQAGSISAGRRYLEVVLDITEEAIASLTARAAE